MSSDELDERVGVDVFLMVHKIRGIENMSRFDAKKIGAMSIAGGLAISVLGAIPANADAASSMSFLIEPTGDFVGLEFRGVRDSGGFEVNEVESYSFFEGFTGDAFDGWGEIYVSDDDWISQTRIVAASLSSCTVTSDGVEVEGLDYQTQDHGNLSRSVSVDCPATAVTLGGGDVDFRVVQVFEGSYFSTRIYASISSGTPNNFRLSVGGDLGSDEDEAVEASGVSNDWNYVVTGGDDGDPTIGYRSKTSFNFDEDPGIVYEDGDEYTWLSTISEITPTSTSELVYEVDTWFVDYSIDQDDTYSFAAEFAGVEFGCAIPTMTAIDTPAVCQSYAPAQAAPYSGPLITDVGGDNKAGRFPISSSQQITVSGERLANVTGASIDGKPCEIISTSNDSFQMITPADLTPGEYDLKIQSSIGNLTYLGAFVVIEKAVVTTSYGTMKAWTTDQGDGTAKIYVKYPELDSKLRIGHQTTGDGEYESIFVRTITSESDETLLVNENGSYIVRTINLETGINRIRVSVDGEEIPVNGNNRPVRYNQ